MSQRIEALPETLAAKTRRGLLDFQRDTLGFSDGRARSNAQAVLNMLDFIPMFSAPANISEGSQAAAQGDVLGSLGYNALGVLDALDGPIPTTAMFLGATAKRAPKAAMDKAREMFPDYSPEYIWDKLAKSDGESIKVDNTGAVTFEISDEPASINNDPLRPDLFNIYDADNVPLDMVIQHDELFSNRPELRDVTFRQAAPDSDYSAAYSSGTNEIELRTKDPEGNVRSLDDLKSSLLHEIQHAEQSVDGRAKGGSHKSGRGVMMESLAMGDSLEFLNKVNQEAIKRAEASDPVLIDLLGKRDAAKAKSSAEGLKEVLRVDEQIKDHRQSNPILSQLYDYQGNLNSGLLSVKEATRLHTKIGESADGSFYVRDPSTGDYYDFANRGEAVDKAYELYGGHIGYQNLAGEVEARLTQERIGTGLLDANPFRSEEMFSHPYDSQFYVDQNNRFMPEYSTFGRPEMTEPAMVGTPLNRIWESLGVTDLTPRDLR